MDNEKSITTTALIRKIQVIKDEALTMLPDGDVYFDTESVEGGVVATLTHKETNKKVYFGLEIDMVKTDKGLFANYTPLKPTFIKSDLGFVDEI